MQCAMILAMRIITLAAAVLVLIISASAQAAKPGSAMPQIGAEELAATLRGQGEKPLVLQVGVARLFRYNHIRGAEFAGPASEPAGIARLRKRVQGLKRSTAIVIYCGCCPWEHCPNVQPAYDELRKMGFRNVLALYLPNNYKFAWKGE
jgi:thiosulfate/3-mercaptopyruvate sulfurtransferase